MIKILIFMFVGNLMANPDIMFDWQGHRGCRGVYPENSIEGMKQALNFPITTLELDVVISIDEQVVVSHEPWMSEEICLDPQGKEVKDKHYNLYSMNYSEIEKFDCGSKTHPRFLNQVKIKTTKPKLSVLMAEVERTLIKSQKSEHKNINYNIEIKSDPQSEKEGFQPSVEKFADLVLKEVLGLIPPKRFSIQSFDWRVLNYISKKYPQVQRVALIEEKYDVKNVLSKLNMPPHVFSPDYNLLTSEDIKYLKSKKIKVIPWTINTYEEMKRIKALGVDGIITDYPNLIGNL